MSEFRDFRGYDLERPITDEEKLISIIDIIGTMTDEDVDDFGYYLYTTYFEDENIPDDYVFEEHEVTRMVVTLGNDYYDEILDALQDDEMISFNHFTNDGNAYDLDRDEYLRHISKLKAPYYIYSPEESEGYIMHAGHSYPLTDIFENWDDVTGILKEKVLDLLPINEIMVRIPRHKRNKYFANRQFLVKNAPNARSAAGRRSRTKFKLNMKRSSIKRRASGEYIKAKRYRNRTKAKRKLQLNIRKRQIKSGRYKQGHRTQGSWAKK